MEYVVKEVKEEVDIMYLTNEEYDSVNKVYFDIMKNRYPRLAQNGVIGNIKRCILTDGLNRVEVLLLKDDQKKPDDVVLLSSPPNNVHDQNSNSNITSNKTQQSN